MTVENPHAGQGSCARHRRRYWRPGRHDAAGAGGCRGGDQSHRPCKPGPSPRPRIMIIFILMIIIIFMIRRRT